ncbi:TPA: hypothetical protein PXP51_002392 [Yersinia enterocolitica]|nr:hypothetical protein [Yersinia enterocolitica]
MKLIGKTHTPSMATSNRSEVHRTGTSPFMKALKGISNSLQKLAGAFGQKSHSLQPADKFKITDIKQEMEKRMDDILKVQSDQASKPHNRRLTPRPTQAPPPPPRASSSTIMPSEVASKPPRPAPPPSLNSNRAASSVSVAPRLTPFRPAPSIPEKANVSQQQPEISTQNGGEPVNANASINDIKMSPLRMDIAAAFIKECNRNFEEQFRPQINKK